VLLPPSCLDTIGIVTRIIVAYLAQENTAILHGLRLRRTCRPTVEPCFALSTSSHRNDQARGLIVVTYYNPNVGEAWGQRLRPELDWIYTQQRLTGTYGRYFTGQLGGRPLCLRWKTLAMLARSGFLFDTAHYAPQFVLQSR
jgi:hypothetical protein